MGQGCEYLHCWRKTLYIYLHIVKRFQTLCRVVFKNLLRPHKECAPYILGADFFLFMRFWIEFELFKHIHTLKHTLWSLWRTHRPINYSKHAVLNLVEGQPVVPAEWVVIKGSWAAAVEKATHQPLVGLDATDGNLWFSFASVRAHSAGAAHVNLWITCSSPSGEVNALLCRCTEM